MAKLTIKYEEGKMIITHPSGIIDSYTVNDVNKFRILTSTKRDKLNERIAYLDDVMLKIQESTVITP